MTIVYHINSNGDLLYVKASGKDDNLDEVMSYNQAVIGAALNNKSKKVLCDERDLIYTISTFDTYNLAEQAATYARYLVRIAIVCSEQSLPDGKFYETVSRNRGLKVLVTSNYDEALSWLNR